MSDSKTRLPLKYFLIISISIVLSLLGLIYNYNYDLILLPLSIVSLTLLGLFIYRKRLLIFGIIAGIQFILLTFSSYFYFSQIGYEYEAYSLLFILVIQVGIMPFLWNRFFYRGLIINSLITFIVFDFIASLISLQFALQNGGSHFQYFWLTLIASILISYILTTMRNRKRSQIKELENSIFDKDIKEIIGNIDYKVEQDVIFIDNIKTALLLNDLEEYTKNNLINRLNGYTIIHISNNDASKVLSIKDKLRPDMRPLEVYSIPKTQINQFINKL